MGAHTDVTPESINDTTEKKGFSLRLDHDSNCRRHNQRRRRRAAFGGGPSDEYKARISNHLGRAACRFPDEITRLSEAALADWNRPEEDAAWAYLQSGK
jgi:hypothetical protein